MHGLLSTSPRTSVLAMDEENARIRTHLQDQAGARSVPELVERVREGISDLLTAARAVPEARLDKPLAPGEWSAAECIRHAAGNNIEDARWILHAAWMGYGPADPPGAVPEDRESLLAKMDEAMESLYVHVLEAAPDGNLEFTWAHPMFGELNWREWLLFLRIHSKDHARQLTPEAAGS